MASVVSGTGAGRGIVRGEALECAAQGAAVVVGEFIPDAGEAVAMEIIAAGGRAVSVGGDVADVAAAQALVDVAVSELGGLDALV